MTREEQVAFCRKCTNRKFDPEQGIICRLTDQKADFHDECPDFNLDDLVKENRQEPQSELGGMDMIDQLSDESVDRLRQYQDFPSAIIGGLLLALIGAMLWASVAVITGYQIGYLAIGIGFIVGFGVRYFGAGVDPKFGYLAAALSVVSCLTGNIFAQIAFWADSQGLTYLQALGMIDFSLLPEIIIETFSAIDILFYGIAIGAAYKYAFRAVTPEDLELMHEQKNDPVPPGYNIRKPVVIVASIMLVSFVFLTNQSTRGTVTFSYEDGSRMSEGTLSNGLEDGEWNYWYPSGKVQASVNFVKSVPHGQWVIYYESGQVMTEGGYEFGNKQGVWMNFYPEGPVQDSGQYILGRENGLWAYYHLNGQMRETGHYKLGQKEGSWKSYYENGQVENEAQMLNDELTSLAKSWYADGTPQTELEVKGENTLVMKSWNKAGKQTIIDGNGTLEEFYPTGELMGRSVFKNGMRNGKFLGFHLDGSKEQEGEYINDIYHFKTTWKPNGQTVIENGNGHYEMFYNMGLVTQIEGDVRDGLKEGDWFTYSESGQMLSKVAWSQGKATGLYTTFHPNGQKWVEGMQVDDKPTGEWNWYYDDGTMESKNNFVDGKKDGLQQFWGANNEVVREEEYKNGELIEARVIK